MTNSLIWLIVGFAGQAIFTARFIVQWIASERKGDSVLPVSFWWISIVGGGTLLAYATYRRDPVIILGQSLGVFVYVRNLMLIMRKRKQDMALHLRKLDRISADGSKLPNLKIIRAA